ncbi:MAG: CHAT domain-containing protein [Thermomicrobiales bacterium]|nr:CHAT domain-containing protein [Thermomicrobiales bacterium]
MSSLDIDPPGLLEELAALTPDRRVTRVREIGSSDELFMRLGDEIERQAVADLGSALNPATIVVELADRLASGRCRARVRRAKAQALAYAGRLDESLASCRSAVELATAANEPVEAARARLASLHPLASLGRFDEARSEGGLAREAFAAVGDLRLAARADLNLGAVLAMHDDPAAALVHLNRARPAFLDDPAILAQLESNRGNALMALDDHQGAEAAFTAAVSAFERGGHPLAYAIAESNRAFLAARQGRLQDALARYERARRILERVDSPAHLARIRAEGAESMVTLGLPGEAAGVFEQIIPELDGLGLAAEAARSRAAHGRALIAIGRFDEAETWLSQAVDAFAALGQRTEQARTLVLRAHLALHQHDGETAQRLADRALDDLRERPIDHALAQALLCRIALKRNDLPAAHDALDQASSINKSYEVAPLTAELATLRGLLNRAQGEPALAAFMTAVDATERIRATLQASRYRTAFHAGRMEPYEALLVESLRPTNGPDLATAFRAAELLKSRTLLDIVGGALDRSTDVDANDDPELRERLEHARAELNWHYSRIDSLAVNDRHGLHIGSLEAEVARIESRIATLRTAPSPSAPPGTLANALNNIEPGTAAVSYVAAGDELIAFVLRDGQCTVHRQLAYGDALMTAARRFRFQISRAQARAQQGAATDRLVPDAQRELRTLWELVFAPLEPSLLGVERLIVAPIGVLHTIPFGALWGGESYLVERIEVRTIPSLSLLARLPNASTGNQMGLSIIGVADEAAPAISREVTHIAAQVPGARIATGDAATAERASQELASAAAVHLACHGRYSVERPRASGLKLVDRWLTLSDISALHLPGSHITLSACDTGRTSISAGDELVGLTSSFFAAGARSLIYSLWPANDASTAELMEACYSGHQAGSSFPAALRSGQRTMIDRRLHPVHWATFNFGGRI